MSDEPVAKSAASSSNEPNLGTERSASDVLLSDANRPQTPEEQAARAQFLTASLGILCSKTLKAYVDHCDRGRSAEQAETGDRPELTMEQYSEAVKELMSISLWLTMFEQVAGGIPDWFKELMLNCHAVSDQVYAKPSAKEIQEKYDLNMPLSEICQLASVNLCMQLNLGGTVNDALLYLGFLLEQEKDNRLDLLTFALTEPIAKLDERIKSA